MKKSFSSESRLNHSDQSQDVPTHKHSASCKCFIVPLSVLERLSKDKKLSADERKSFADAAQVSTEMRKTRIANGKMSNLSQSILPTSFTAASAAAVGPPAVSVFNCGNGTSLPGTPVVNPGTSADPTIMRTFVETTAVATFYKTLFGRNSIDNANMTLLSSVHFSVKHNNAFWDGTQMTYGDGDGNIFVDFTKSNDVIAHKAAIAIGGKSWEKAGMIWYQALTGFPPSPTMKMRKFASRTRSSATSLFPAEPAVFTAVDKAWKAVGIP